MLLPVTRIFSDEKLHRMHVLVCTNVCPHTWVSGVLCESCSICMFLCVSVMGAEQHRERQPFGNNGCLLLGIPCFLFLRTGCPSCNTITVTTTSITVATELQVNKREEEWGWVKEKQVEVRKRMSKRNGLLGWSGANGCLGMYKLKNTEGKLETNE